MCFIKKSYGEKYHGTVPLRGRMGGNFESDLRTTFTTKDDNFHLLFPDPSHIIWHCSCGGEGVFT